MSTMTRKEVLERAHDSHARGVALDLHGANLSGANLHGANLHGANLSGAIWAGLCIDGLPSGRALLIPTPSGWVRRVGCWVETPTQSLRDLIAGNTWPSGCGPKEREARRPGLTAVADLLDAHEAANPETIPALAAKWGA